MLKSQRVTVHQKVLTITKHTVDFMTLTHIHKLTHTHTHTRRLTHTKLTKTHISLHTHTKHISLHTCTLKTNLRVSTIMQLMYNNIVKGKFQHIWVRPYAYK